VVEVRDSGGEWEPGVVVDIKDDDQREEVMVLKDQWDTPYCWDEIRHMVVIVCIHVYMYVFVERNSPPHNHIWIYINRIYPIICVSNAPANTVSLCSEQMRSVTRARDAAGSLKEISDCLDAGYVTMVSF
jgi:hypothetical protein